MTTVRRRIAERVTAEVEPCACDGRDGICGFHFAQLSNRERVDVRMRLGIVGGGPHPSLHPETRKRAETWGETVMAPQRRPVS